MKRLIFAFFFFPVACFASVPHKELKREILGLEEKLKTSICENWTDEFHRLPIHDAPAYFYQVSKCNRDLILSTQSCRGASKELQNLLLTSLPDLKVERVTTVDNWVMLYQGPDRYLNGSPVPGDLTVRGLIAYTHTFLIVPDYFGANKHLYIDPTYSQHFFNSTHLNLGIAEKIFIGSYEELKAALDPFRVKNIEYYLNVYPDP